MTLLNACEDEQGQAQIDLQAIVQMGLFLKYGAEVPSLLIVVAKQAKLVLTPSIVESVARALAAEPVKTWTEVTLEDLLFDAGILGEIELGPEIPCDLTRWQKASVLVAEFHSALAKARYHWNMKALYKVRRRLQISQRHFKAECERFYRAQRGASLWEMAEEFAQALEGRNLQYLLDLADQPGNANMFTRQVLARHGLFTLGMPSAERRRRIFEFCGMDANAQAQYELERQLRLEVKRAGEVAARMQVSWATGEGDGRCFIDAIVAQGFTSLVKSKSGAATQYWLTNCEEGRSYPLRAKALWQYAKCLDALRSHLELIPNPAAALAA